MLTNEIHIKANYATSLPAATSLDGTGVLAVNVAADGDGSAEDLRTQPFMSAAMDLARASFAIFRISEKAMLPLCLMFLTFLGQGPPSGHG